MLGSIAAALRTGEWWHHKLVPILTAVYATALVQGQAVSDLWLEGLIFFSSLLPGAAFVSLVNDLTDIRCDGEAGKANRMAAHPRPVRALALGASLGAGVPFFWYWADRPLLIALYGAAWISFALYSIPPARLKIRGAAGLAADAAGAHLFPTLLAGAVVFSASGAPLQPGWMAMLALWSFAYGCRGILWHQLCDLEGDRRAGLATFAARHSPRFVSRSADIVFAVEVAALLALLLQLAELLPVLALLYYVMLAWRRHRCRGMPTIVARPRAAYRFWLADFYGVLLPIPVLIIAAARHPADLFILAFHLALFWRSPFETASDSWNLVLIPILNRVAKLRTVPRGS